MGNQSGHLAPLPVCIESQDFISAVKLLQNGADPNTLSAGGKSCLRIALEQGHSQMYRVLHQMGGELIPPLGAESPLHFAVRLGHTKLVRMFLRQSKVFPKLKNAKNSQGRTPLHIAAETGQSEIVALLLKYNALAEVRDCMGKTPKDLAVEGESAQVSEILELLGSEELVVKTPNPGKDAKESAHLRRISSKSTHFSSMVDSETNFMALENAMSESMIQMIPSSEIQFLEVINRGSSCVVHRGMWRGTQVAIKQFKLEYSTSAKELEKFIKEMQVLSTVRHPNLILLMGVCIDSPNLCLISELVAHSSLFQAIHKSTKPLSLETRMRIAIQITQGLAYLHSFRPPIIHRDLKPENVLVKIT
jgi:ankyrin repeat protein